jgi:hypothetical protein
MTDQGYPDNSAGMRLTLGKQLLRVLANTILDVRLQTMGMTDQQALDLMINDTYQEKEEATAKLQRAKLSSTQLPTYFAGWKGWLQVRGRYRRSTGVVSRLRISTKKPSREVLSRCRRWSGCCWTEFGRNFPFPHFRHWSILVPFMAIFKRSAGVFCVALFTFIVSVGPRMWDLRVESIPPLPPPVINVPQTQVVEDTIQKNRTLVATLVDYEVPVALANEARRLDSAGFSMSASCALETPSGSRRKVTVR